MKSNSHLIALNRPEVRAKARAAADAKWSAAKKAAHACPEVKAKHRVAVKAALFRPEVRAKISAALKASHARPEVKTKLSAASKARRATRDFRGKQLQAWVDLPPIFWTQGLSNSTGIRG